jgi:uncharacterized protein (TIGR03437 family)
MKMWVRGCLYLSVFLLTVLTSRWGVSSQVGVTLSHVAVESASPDVQREGRDSYWHERLPAGETRIPIERYLDARQHMKSMPQFSTAENRNFIAEQSAAPEALGTWTSLGPGNLGGRVRAMIFHPTNPNVMYAATVMGGVWRTTNAGANWEPLTDLMPNLAFTCLTFDPQNPNTLYAATGESSSLIGRMKGGGIFKSTDGGNVWSHLSTTNTEDFAYINKLVVSPNNSQRLYAATENGLFRSTDGGANWSRLLTNPNGFPEACWDVVMRKDKTTDYVFAAHRSNNNVVVSRNVDAGGVGVWESVFSNDFSTKDMVLALAPSNQGVIYVLLRDGNGFERLKGIHRSTINGDSGTWTSQLNTTGGAKSLNTSLLNDPMRYLATECGMGVNPLAIYGFYARTLAVDPVDPNRLWAGSVSLFRSDDGGANWGLASYANAASNAPQYLPAGQNVIAFAPAYNGTTNQTMFVGNDGGVYRTTNSGAKVASGFAAACNPNNTSVSWISLNTNFSATLFYHGQPFPDGSSYLGATQNNGIVKGSDADGNNGWRTILAGIGSSVAIDYNQPHTIYATTTDQGTIWKSTDDGATFSRAMAGVQEAGASYPVFRDLLIDPSDSQRVWAGGWLTENAAGRWRTFAGGDRGGRAISPFDSNFILLGGDHIRRTRNGLSETVTWEQSASRSGSLSWLAFDPKNNQVAYATYSSLGGKHVYRTSDGGMSWLTIDGNGTTALPDVPVHCLVVDPNDTARLYVGTDLGVFVSTDGGANWAVEKTGFGGFVTKSLAVNTVKGVTHLYAFTFGRGVWRVMVSSTPNSCQQTLSPASTTIQAAGGSGVVSLTASSSNCSWSATSNTDWLTLTSATSGSGAASISYYAAPNESYSFRTGTITIAGRSFTLRQEAKADTEAPQITITVPAMTGVTSVRSRLLNLKGTMTDNVKLVANSWVTDRGFSGTDPFFMAIPLQPGLNRITLTARDAAGNTASVSLSVRFVPEYLISTIAGTGTGGFNGDGGKANLAHVNAPGGIALDKTGNLYFADSANFRIRKIATDGTITTIAGTGVADPAMSGDDGLATVAKLAYPRDLTVDDKGDVYFIDGGRRLRKVTASNGIITSVATVGGQFFSANDVVVDGQGNYLVTEGGGGFHRIIKVTPGGAISHFAGTENTYSPLGDGGPASVALLNTPRGITVDQAGTVYFADSSHQRVRKITPNGIINTVAGNGLATGPFGDGGLGPMAMLWSPQNVTTDQAGNLYITQPDRIRKVTTDGIINTIAGNGNTFYNGDGQVATSASLSAFGIAADNSGNIYFADPSNHRIRKLTPIGADNIPPALTITTPGATPLTTPNRILSLVGTSADNTLVAQVAWNNDRGGSGVMSDVSNWTAQVFLAPGRNQITVSAWDILGNETARTITVIYKANAVFNLVAGQPAVVIGSPSAIVGGFSGDNELAVNARLLNPQGVAADGSGNIYIADSANHRIRKIAPNGIITTYAGIGVIGSSGDGGFATNATLNEPGALVADTVGNLYVADTNNHRIRKINPSGIITTVVGTGGNGFSGDGEMATNARLSFPIALALDVKGDLLIVDAGNSRIRKFSMGTGLLGTIAGGSQGYGGDNGLAIAAQLRNPTGIAVDQPGNIYLADSGNYRIRKIAPDGIITTIGGTGVDGVFGNGILATMAAFRLGGGLALDGAGNLYVAERYANHIRRISRDGYVTTFAGNGNYSFDSFGSASGDALSAQLNSPLGLTVDRAGNLFIADTNNHRVVVVATYQNAATVSAASYATTQPVAAESIVSVFGANLAIRDQGVTQLPLPTELVGTSVKVRDSLGVERLALLFYVGRLQVNYQIPAGTASGWATITITNGNGEIFTGAVNIAAVTPGLFTANQNGSGAAAATILYFRNGTPHYESNFRCNAQGQNCTARPIDLSAGDEVFLELYGTGIRNNSGLPNVTVTVGGVSVPVLYASKQPDFIGLDQVNIQLPKTLAGRGEVDVVLTVDGKAANPVNINLQ